MRAILVTVMLIVVAIAIYNATVGGENGTQQQVKDTGGRMNVTIQQISP